jgi:hypothetical protein
MHRRWIGIAALVVASCGGAAVDGERAKRARSPAATASGGDEAPLAVDGDLSTRWRTGAAQARGQWFQVDLKAREVVAGVTMRSGDSAGEYARSFEVFAFDDPAGMGEPAARGKGDAQVVTASFAPRLARHVRVVLTDGAANAWSLHEIELSGAPSPAACVAAISPHEDLDPEERDARYQEELTRYCTGVGLGECEQALRARMKVDATGAAAQVLTGLLATGAHIALLRDHDARLRAFRGDPALACEVAAHDADGDYVADARDACPGTPRLTPVRADGCANTAVPAGPELEAVQRLMPRVALTLDARCAHVAPPVTPTPLGVFRLSRDPSVGKAIWLTRDPGTTGCPLFYEVEAVLNGGSFRSVVFAATEDVELPWTKRPDRAVQLNVRASDGGDRAEWADYGAHTRWLRARAVNLVGQRSAWSERVRPETAECAAGLPTGDGLQ